MKPRQRTRLTLLSLALIAFGPLGPLGLIDLLGQASQTLAANPTLPAEITVTSHTVTRNVEPIGANLGPIAGGTNFAINNHVWSSGFEPIIARKFVRMDRTGMTADGSYAWFEWDQEGGPGYWNLAWTGMLNGATIRFYRMVDNNGNPLDYAGQTDMNEVDNADHVIFLGEAHIPMPNTDLPDGGYIANDERDGDTSNDMGRVYIDNTTLDLHYGDYAYIKLKTTTLHPENSPPDLRQYFSGLKNFFGAYWNSEEWTPALVPHPQPLPANFTDGGETCLQITFAEPVVYQLGQYVYHPYDEGSEGQRYSQLHPGARYRVSVWLRQENLGNDGKVRFVFSHPPYNQLDQPTPWQVTGEWQQFTYDFTAPAYPTSGAHIAHQLQFTGGPDGTGKVWIDNFLLYRYDEAHEFQPFTPHEISFNELMNSVPATGKKPALRIYSPIFHEAELTSMFTNYGNATLGVSWNMGVEHAPVMTIAQALSWAYKTGDSPANRMVPYLTCNEEYTEADWTALVEYLGVPYDPTVDTPASKPYAYMRYVYRGNNPTPWTEEFREVLVEYGNESWHNGAGGYGWQGWARPGYVNFGGKEYGLFAHYMLEQHAMQQPAWTAYNLADKIKFVLGANYDGAPSAYGELAVQQATSIPYIGHANYVGPKWETGDTGQSIFDDHGVQMTLLGLYTDMKPLIENAAVSRDQLNTTTATNYKIIAYEGGPSGYWSNQENPDIDEQYGKSVAMGVAALDTWLYSSLHGYTYQDYLGFNSGKWWTSHTMPEAGGFRAHPGWLTLKMRNRYAPGSQMLQTVHNSQPTISSDGRDIPLISSYVLQDGRRFSVFLISRKLDGNHDGIDFGRGYTPATLHLPFSQVSSITRYRLESPDGTPVDPRSNNRTSENVVIGSKTISTSVFTADFPINESTGGEAEGLPPGSATLYVFELPAPGLADGIAILQSVAGMTPALSESAKIDIDGDDRVGLAEAIGILKLLSVQQSL